VLGTNVLANAARSHRLAMYRSAVQQVGRILAAWSVVFTLMAVGIFLFKASIFTPASGSFSWYASGAILLVAFRTVLARSGPSSGLIRAG